MPEYSPQDTPQEQPYSADANRRGEPISFKPIRPDTIIWIENPEDPPSPRQPSIVPPADRGKNLTPETTGRDDQETAAALAIGEAAMRGADQPDDRPIPRQRTGEHDQTSDNPEPAASGPSDKEPPIKPPEVGQESADEPPERSAYYDVSAFEDRLPDPSEQDVARFRYGLALKVTRQRHADYKEQRLSDDGRVTDHLITELWSPDAVTVFRMYDNVLDETDPHNQDLVVTTRRADTGEERSHYYYEKDGVIVRHTQNVNELAEGHNIPEDETIRVDTYLEDEAALGVNSLAITPDEARYLAHALNASEPETAQAQKLYKLVVAEDAEEQQPTLRLGESRDAAEYFKKSVLRHFENGTPLQATATEIGELGEQFQVTAGIIPSADTEGRPAVTISLEWPYIDPETETPNTEGLRDRTNMAFEVREEELWVGITHQGLEADGEPSYTSETTWHKAGQKHAYMLNKLLRKPRY